MILKNPSKTTKFNWKQIIKQFESAVGKNSCSGMASLKLGEG